jgi:glycosyltransferase involved in cell wall biosynthesis
MRARRRQRGRSGPLRVLFPYDGATFGGSHVSSLLLARSLMARGHEPLVVAHGAGRASSEALSRGLPVRLVKSLWRRSPPRGADRARPEHLLAWAGAVRTLLETKPHVVHVNDLAMLRVWGVPARLVGVPLVKHWRSNYRPSATVDLGLRCATTVIAVSQSARDQLPGWIQDRTVVEYNPIEAADATALCHRSSAKAALGLPVDAWVIGVFGALSKRKRPHVLAEVLGRFPAMTGGRPVIGIAAGEAFDSGDPEFEPAIAHYCLRSRILRPGFVHPVQPWMAACDLVLVPAVDEPFGRTPLEAMACGAPVIVSSGCGAVEVLTHGHDAIILPPEPVDAWVKAAADLLANEALAADLVRNGRATLARLCPEDHARRVEAIYRGLRTKTSSPAARR